MIQHSSDCAVHNEPAYPAGPCSCGATRRWIANVVGDAIAIALLVAIAGLALFGGFVTFAN